MRGNRQPRGITDRVGKIEGQGYTGDPAGAVAPWTGSGASSPAIDQYPTIPLVVDENDDGSTTMDSVGAAKSSGRKSTRNTTKARLRWPLMILANWIAWLKDLAAGARSFKAVVVDGTGGVAVAGIPGEVSATGNGVFGGNVNVAGDANVTGQVVTSAGNIRSAGDVYGNGFFAATSAAGSAAPTPSNFDGYLSKELIPCAWLIYSPTGGLFVQGSNIQSVSYDSVGHYTFVTQRAAVQGASNSICALATASGTGMIATATATNSGGHTSIAVTVTDATGAPADPNTVSVLVFGG